MSDQKVTIPFEAELDDLQKSLDGAFAKIRKKIKSEVQEPLNEAVQPKGKKAKDAGETFGEQFAAGLKDSVPFAGMASGAFLAYESVVKLKELGTELFNVFEGEKVLKIEKNFDSLAKSFGVAGDTLKDSFVGSAGGLVDDTDLIQTLSEKIVTFGGKVENLPQLFELSRKAANLFGKDAQEVFQALSFAAETGNTRGIRFLFPKLDLDKGLKEYAVKIGKLESELTPVERQQFALNKILEEGGKKLEGVSTEAGTASEAYQKLKVSIGQLFEASQKSTAQSSGGFLKGLFDELRFAIDPVKVMGPIKTFSEAESEAGKVQKRITELTEKAQNSNFLRARSLENEIASLKTRLNEINALRDKFAEEKFTSQKPSEVAPGIPVQKTGPSEAFLKAQTELIRKSNDEKLQADIAYQNSLLNNKITTGQKLAALETSLKEQELLANSQFAQKKDDAAKSLLDKGLITDQQYKDKAYASNETYQLLIQNAAAIHQDKLAQIQADGEEKRRALRDNAKAGEESDLINLGNAYDQFFVGINQKAIESANTFGKQMRSMGQAAMGALQNQAAKAFLSFAKGAKSGSEALSDFFNGFLAAMGEMMVTSGFGYVLQGIALSFVPGMQATGSALMSAGGAMIAFGGVLAALGGKGASAPSGADTGGGVVGGGSTSTGGTMAQQPEATIQEKKPTVNITVQGNVMDNRQTGLYLAEVLDDAFRDQDIVFRGA